MQVIGHLYEKFGNKMMERGLLDGMFAFVVSDETTGRFMAARDHIGICPLYYGRSGDGRCAEQGA
jgi:asparagine synthase (glutamine-hydrolysing)